MFKEPSQPVHPIDPNKIGVLGFSAGGHLAACVSQGFDRAEWLLDPDGALVSTSARPDASILSYPVISSGDLGHQGSFDNRLGKESDRTQRDALSWDKHAHPNSPPTFLWHTADEDAAVPVENSYLMAIDALEDGSRLH